MGRIIKRVFLACSGLAFGLVLTACLWPGRFAYSSVCSLCGLESRNSEIHLGLFETQFAPTQQLETNAISNVLLSRRELLNHQHAWVFAAGGGAGIKCAIGHGRHLRQAVRSTNVAAFLQQLGKSSETNSLWRWRDRLLDPEQSRDAVMAVANAEDDRDEAQTWPMAAEAIFRELRKLQPAGRR